MRSISGSALSFGALLYLFTLLVTFAAAVDRGPGNRPNTPDASPLVSNGIASQLPLKDRIVTSDEHHHHIHQQHRDPSSVSPRLVHRLASSGMDEIASSLNVKAVAHVGFNMLLDLASPNALARFMGNDTVNLFAKTVPSWEGQDNAVADGCAASPRRKIAGMSIALTLVMIFFIVYM